VSSAGGVDLSPAEKQSTGGFQGAAACGSGSDGAAESRPAGRTHQADVFAAARLTHVNGAAAHATVR
jgi:hypothetical protein